MRCVLPVAFVVAVSLAGGGGPDAGGYRYIDSDSAAGPVFEWVDISGVGTPVELGDDDNKGPFALGFAFQFYGQNYDSIRICSNGWLSFTSSSHQFHHYRIPGEREPNALLAPWWVDLDPAAGGAIYYLADSANARFVVSWVGVPFHGTRDSCTFQVVLVDGGDIVYRYLEVPAGSDSCSVGIEDAAGSVGLEYLYDGAPPGNRLRDSLAVRFFRLDHDAFPGDIGRPFESELAGMPFRPVVTVHNAGRVAESLQVALQMTGYEEIVVVPYLAPLDRQVVRFPAVEPDPGTHEVLVVTTLAGDEDPANDTVRLGFAVSRAGELRHDDGAADEWMVRVGSPTADWAALARFPTPGHPFRLAGARVFVEDTAAFSRLLVCTGDSVGPDLERVIFEEESASASAPSSWLEVVADTMLESVGDLWLVAFWPRGADGPRVGDDRTVPVDGFSWFGSPTVAWLPHRDGDLMMRLALEVDIGIEELEPVLRPVLRVTPSPFHERLHVKLGAPLTGEGRVRVFDATGRLVGQSALMAGEAEWTWDGTGNSGQRLPAGAYFIEARAGSEAQLAKVLLTR